MNYLAHAWLSGPDSRWILGGFLGDHVRGARWKEFPDAVARGILLHRRIDGYTDDHPAYIACRERFNPPFRRYAGILLDLGFDHVLARHWERHAEGSLQAFERRCYDILGQHWRILPRSLRRFAGYARSRGLLAGYRDGRIIEASLRGISGRLSRPNPLHRGWEALEPLLPEIERGFERLFPDLQSFAEDQRRQLAAAEDPAAQD